MTQLPLAFYGDDFTGSADVLMQCARWGMTGSIMLGAPTIDRLQEEAEGKDLIGIAGVTRSLAAPESTPIIGTMFRRLRELSPRAVQYKVCSTADSSPSIGSFRPAIELGREIFGAQPVPVLAAQPNLARYTAFSTHFAMDQGEVLRLDRQVMANHPITPMREADLRRHLEKQLPEGSAVGEIHLTDLHRPGGAHAAYERATTEGRIAVIVDAVTDADLLTTGLLLKDLSTERTVFGIGSAGFSIGFSRAVGFDRASSLPAVSRSPKPCLAVSGSCSSLSREQIQYALDHGWHGIAVDAGELDPHGARFASILDEVMAELRSGTSVVVYTCGPDQQVSDVRVDARRLSETLADVVTRTREQDLIDRAMIVGGDTSGLVVMAMGAVAMAGKAVVGDHHTLVFELDAPESANHHLEVVLKGGQIGGVDFFEQARLGVEAGGYA